jgi:S1-C subfamily serine protease
LQVGASPKNGCRSSGSFPILALTVAAPASISVGASSRSLPDLLSKLINAMETKRIFRYLALILCLICPFAANAQERRSGPTTSALSAEQIARQSLPSVVLIVCDNGAGDTSLGSGFFVTPNVVVTNYHVIEGMVHGTVRSAVSHNKKENWVITAVLNFDEESDLALIRVPGASKSNLPVLPLAANERVSIGQTIYALGNPEGLVGTISPGIISGLRTLNSQRLIQVTAPISHGSSGGPIVNSVGEVVGVAQGSLSEGQNLNFAVPAPLVSALISKTNMQITTSETQAWKITEGNNWAWLVSGDPAIQKASKVQRPSVIGALRSGESTETASLRKLAGVHLIIEDLDQDTKTILSERQIQTDVELRLRRNGIRLLSEDEWQKVPGSPFLYLRLSVLRNERTGVFSYYYRLELNQTVLLDRDPQFRMLAVTWLKTNGGYAGSAVAPSAIREAIGDTVDRFCNDFLAAN